MIARHPTSQAQVRYTTYTVRSVMPPLLIADFLHTGEGGRHTVW